MKDFAERFHLSRPEKGFEIAPWDPEDAGTYFGDKKLNVELQGRIEAGYNLGTPPKIYLQGRWGAGKTHHLYHTKHVLESVGLPGLKNFLVPYLSVECEDDTDYQYMHRKLLNALGLELIKDAVSEFLMEQGANRADAQRKLFGNNNLIIATQVLAYGDDQLAWKWLSGDKLTSGELRALNTTTNLEDTTELTDVLVRLGRLLANKGKNILFFIDEAEALKNVHKPNAQRSWHDGIKNLADGKNNSVGYVIAIFVDNNNPAPEFIMEEDILRRMGQRNRIDVPPYGEADEIKPFLDDLLRARIKVEELSELPTGVEREHYPFAEDAYDLFLNQLLLGVVSATPSKMIEGVSECAWEAHLRDEDSITFAVVDEVMPRVMSQI